MVYTTKLKVLSCPNPAYSLHPYRFLYTQHLTLSDPRTTPQSTKTPRKTTMLSVIFASAALAQVALGAVQTLGSGGQCLQVTGTAQNGSPVTLGECDPANAQMGSTGQQWVSRLGLGSARLPSKVDSVAAVLSGRRHSRWK